MSLKYLQLIADLMKISKLQLHVFFVKRERKKLLLKGRLSLNKFLFRHIDIITVILFLNQNSASVSILGIKPPQHHPTTVKNPWTYASRQCVKELQEFSKWVLIKTSSAWLRSAQRNSVPKFDSDLFYSEKLINWDCLREAQLSNWLAQPGSPLAWWVTSVLSLADTGTSTSTSYSTKS